MAEILDFMTGNKKTDETVLRQCPQCRTLIRPGQIHSAHGWTELDIKTETLTDEDQGRALFLAGEVERSGNWRLGRKTDAIPASSF